MPIIRPDFRGGRGGSGVMRPDYPGGGAALWTDANGLVLPHNIFSTQTPLLVGPGVTLCPTRMSPIHGGKTYFVSGRLVDAP